MDLSRERLSNFFADFNEFWVDLKTSVDRDKLTSWYERFQRDYPEAFRVGEAMETEGKKTRSKKLNLAEIREKLLCKRTTERFIEYQEVMADSNLDLTAKINHLQKAIDDATRKKFTMPHSLENCYKVALMNRRKPIRKHWRRLRLRDSGRNFCVSCTNWFLTIINFSIVRFLFVSFKSTSKR